MSLSQKEKATTFRAQHTAGKLLILPNVWDALSAKLLTVLGYPSLATASIATSIANGYADGEYIPYDKMMDIVTNITQSTELPVSVDLERGFAEDIDLLKDNIKRLLDAGAIGLNIEDSLDHGKEMTPVAIQCKKIEAIREVGIQQDIPIVINARTDYFFQPPQPDTLQLVIERGLAYKAAGADCFYPILIQDYEMIEKIAEATKMPLNVTLFGPLNDLKKLESIGAARVSVGPALFMMALNKMKKAAEGLLEYNTTEFYAQEPLGFDFMAKLV